MAQLDGPIEVNELCRRVLDIAPSRAKNPLAAVRNHVRQEHIGRSVIFLDAKTVLPLRLAMKGVRFRVPVSRREADQGVLIIYPAFQYFLRRELEPDSIQLREAKGNHLIPVRLTTVRERVETPFGKQVVDHPAFDLGRWFDREGVRRKDSVLVTIENWEEGRFRLEHEPAKYQREEEIARRDQELSDILFDLLEEARNEFIYGHEAIATAYALMPSPGGYPGSHWIEVVHRDPRMRYDGSAGGRRGAGGEHRIWRDVPPPPLRAPQYAGDPDDYPFYLVPYSLIAYAGARAPEPTPVPSPAPDTRPVSMDGSTCISCHQVIFADEEHALFTGQPMGDAQTGEALFEQLCVSCHGEDGTTPVGPDESMINSEAYWSTHDDSAILEDIGIGSHGQMTAFVQDYGGPLTWEEVLDITAYVRTWGPFATPPAEPPAAGEVSYVETIGPLLTERCGSCHGGTAGLTVTDYASLMAGTDSRPARGGALDRDARRLRVLRAAGIRQLPTLRARRGERGRTAPRRPGSR